MPKMNQKLSLYDKYTQITQHTHTNEQRPFYNKSFT